MWGFLLKRFDSAQALLPDWWACMRAIADLGKGRNCDRLVDIIAPFLESFVAKPIRLLLGCSIKFGGLLISGLSCRLMCERCVYLLADLSKGRNCDRLADGIAPLLESFAVRASSAGYMGFVCALVELRS